MEKEISLKVSREEVVGILSELEWRFRKWRVGSSVYYEMRNPMKELAEESRKLT